ncbi:hypothetical protein BH10ACT2_BH10ACT2_03530 [soil metagenome]
MRPEQWAERHDGILPNEAAAKGGLSRGQRARRRATGRSRPVRRGVDAIAGAPHTWLQQVRAAALACGPKVSLALATAARLLGADVVEDGWIHVIGAPSRVVRLDGIKCHRSTTIEPGDVTKRHGIQCTSPLRTVIDMSGTLSVSALGKLVDHFLRSRQLTLEALRERVDRLRPAAGRSVKRLRIVLGARLPGYDPGESELEGRIARIIDRAGLERPTQQHRVRVDGDRYRIDFAWPDRKLYLEGNGFGFHRLSSDLAKDATRQNSLVLDGWTPIEITWSMSNALIADTIRRFQARV